MVQPARLADSCIELVIKMAVSTENSFDAQGEINGAIVESFRKRGIVIPFPQREVRMVGDTLVLDALKARAVSAALRGASAACCALERRQPLRLDQIGT